MDGNWRFWIINLNFAKRLILAVYRKNSLDIH